MSILNENVDRIRSVMGLVNEEDSRLQMNVNLRKTVDVLKYLKLYTSLVESLLMDISFLSKSQIIDFGLLERGLKKVLLKKGDRKRNVEDYLNKILVSLEDRQESGDVDADIDDYSFEVEEPSIIPTPIKKINHSWFNFSSISIPPIFSILGCRDS